MEEDYEKDEQKTKKPDSLTEIVAVGRGLRSISRSITLPAGIKVLDVSENRIESLDDVKHNVFPSLRTIRLRMNRLTTLPRLCEIAPSLVELDVSHNSLDDAIELVKLSESKDLRRVCIRGNPVVRRMGRVDLSVFVVFLLPKLEWLDAQTIGEVQQRRARETFCEPDGSIKRDLIEVLDRGDGGEIEDYLLSILPPLVEEEEEKSVHGVKRGKERVSLEEVEKRVDRMETHIRYWLRRERLERSRSVRRLQRWWLRWRRGGRFNGLKSSRNTASLPFPFLEDLTWYPPRIMTMRLPPSGTRARRRVAASLALQSWWRGLWTRRGIARLILFDAASIRIQAIVRGHIVRKHMKSNPFYPALVATSRRLLSLEQRLLRAERSITARDEALRVLWQEVKSLRK